MRMHPIFSALAVAALVFCTGEHRPAFADDAEIYLNDELPPDSMPLVMFSLDYRSNLGRPCSAAERSFLGFGANEPCTFFDALRAILEHVLEPLSGLKIGLMLNHDYQNNCEGPEGARPNCANGGYIAMGFDELQEDDANGVKARFISVLDSMPTPTSGQGPDPSHNYQGRELFYEFYRYLAGKPVYNGMNGFKSYDHNTGNNSRNIVPEYASRWVGTPSESINGFGPDPTIIQGAVISDVVSGRFSNVGTYISPLSSVDDCTKIFTINFMFQVSQQESNSNDVIAADIGLAPNCQGPGCQFARMVEYLNRTDLAPNVEGDQKVTSYFLGPSPQVFGNTFQAYASAGGTGNAQSIDVEPTVLIEALNEWFKQILSVSTTFTAAALPVNSFDRAQVLNDVFLALFQPQADRFPLDNSYWWGNVKKLNLSGLGDATDVVQLVDARGQPAVAADGRMRFDALSFWTDPAGFDVVDAGRDPDENAVPGRDGRSVNRGGAGHKTPGFPRAANHHPGLQNPIGEPLAAGQRRMFYDSGFNSLAALNATGTVAATLQDAIGASSEAEALEVLRFMRGLFPTTTPEVPLEWMFGSAMHSRPIPVNYGAMNGHSADNPLIYIAVGGNDGALRFIRNTDSNGNELGQESWAFVPTEVMGNIRAIVKQEGPIFSGDSTIYGFDGPPTLYIEDKDGDGTIEAPDDRAIIVAGLRLGGRAYYALDVTNPDSPELLWRITADSPGFEDLGWAFSQPRVGKVSLPSVGPTTVAIFGGGFDRAYDDPSVSPSNPQGNGIYVVNLETGALIRHLTHASMLDSIPSTVTAVDTSGNGLLDRIVVGDLGGRIWRVDMSSGTDPATWPVSLLADLGRHAAGTGAGTAADRRFFNPPDIVQTRRRFETGEATAETIKFDAILIGSGDRENPLYNTPNNWFFMIRDVNIGVLEEPVSGTGFPILLEDFTDVTMITGADVPIDSPGWAFAFQTPGEKNLAGAITVANTVFFTTYIPPGSGDSPANVCGPSEGSGRLYTVSLQNANPPNNRDEVIDDGDSTLDPSDRWEPLKSGGIPAEVVVIPPDRILRPDLEIEPVPIVTRWRTFWYLEEDPVQ